MNDNIYMFDSYSSSTFVTNKAKLEQMEKEFNKELNKRLEVSLDDLINSIKKGDATMHKIKLYFDEGNMLWQNNHEVNKEFIRQRFKYLKEMLAKNEVVSLAQAVREFGFDFINPAYFEYGFTKETGLHIKVEKNFIESQDDWVNIQNTTWMIFEVVLLKDYVN